MSRLNDYKLKSSDERFWKYVKKSNSCWEWTGTKFTQGYGSFHIRLSEWKYKREKAHRYSYKLHFGSLPKNLDVCHKCDNRICVNPKHLFLGTKLENTMDMVSKNRQAKGSKLNTNLNESNVLNIRKEYISGITMKELSKKYKSGYTTINYIINRKTWRHI